MESGYDVAESGSYSLVDVVDSRIGAPDAVNESRHLSRSVLFGARGYNSVIILGVLIASRFDVRLIVRLG